MTAISIDTVDSFSVAASNLPSRDKMAMIITHFIKLAVGVDHPTGEQNH
jgi:hypothetical protein